MNSIDIKTEKTNAIFRYQNLNRITILLRFFEICVFLGLISTFSVRINVDSLRGVSFACLSPKFVFVIGNVIVLILLFKSRVADDGDPYGRIDVYDEQVKRCERKVCRSQSGKLMRAERKDSQIQQKLTPEICQSQSEKLMRFKCKDNQSQRKLAPEICQSQSEKLMRVECKNNQSHLTAEICRSQSEKLMKVECEDGQSQRKLRRSVTERKMLKSVECCDELTLAPERQCVDGLSSEAFRQTVEAFIARQQRCLRDEELAPVAYVGE